MKARKYLLIALVVALLLPGAVAAGEWNPVTGTVQFVGGGAEKQFDKRIGPYYAMPTAGGEVTMRLGAYSGRMYLAPEAAPEAFAQDGETSLVETPNLLPRDMPPLTYVRVRIFDRENPARVLYEFEGDMEAFVSQPGIEVKFNGPNGVLITKSANVPEGQTWWRGQLETYAGVQRGHSDVNLIQGGLQAWIDAHGGTW